MGRNKALVILFCCICLLKANSQTAPMTYLVSFTDKTGSPYSISNPQAYLSSKAIERRTRFNIPIDHTDLPVNPNYIAGLNNISGIHVIARSKWFNNATVMLDDTALLANINALPYVLNVKSSTGIKNTLGTESKTQAATARGNVFFAHDSLNYGLAANQVEMLNGQFLHQMGYTGEGISIAVMDVGYENAEYIPGFQHLFQQARVIQGPDFVHRDGNVFGSGTHGTMVLSCMATSSANEYVGTAPGATYYLFVTENDSSEYPVEEDYWVAAAEWADSAGVDVFNTSLGYSVFTDSTMNHTYAELDGNTTRITCGVDMAARKGILSVNSAGNSGQNSWYYITAPADADSNLTVGAVGPDRMYVEFSSKGPSADGRIKPNIATQGSQAAAVQVWGGILPVNGTSFASPIMAGIAACLWQAFPERNNMEIIHAIEQSASQYYDPDVFVGHGIPDMAKAYHLLSNTYSSSSEFKLTVLNNPFADYCRFVFNSPFDNQLMLDVYDFTGKKVTTQNIRLNAGQPEFYTLDAGDRLLPAGVYIVKVTDNVSAMTVKLVKQ